jgi:hypothetical protein
LLSEGGSKVEYNTETKPAHDDPLSGKARSVTLRDHGLGRNRAGSYEEGVAPLTRGCSAQSWDPNSSESCAWKFRVIWSRVLPIGGPEGLNTQAHSEQPHPTTLCSLIHTFLRDELSWPGVGIQHLTSGQRKVRHAPLPNRTKAGPASIHDFFTRDSLAERVGTKARSYKPEFPARPDPLEHGVKINIALRYWVAAAPSPRLNQRQRTLHRTPWERSETSLEGSGGSRVVAVHIRPD